MVAAHVNLAGSATYDTRSRERTSLTLRHPHKLLKFPLQYAIYRPKHEPDSNLHVHTAPSGFGCPANLLVVFLHVSLPNEYRVGRKQILRSVGQAGALDQEESTLYAGRHGLILDSLLAIGNRLKRVVRSRWKLFFGSQLRWMSRYRNWSADFHVPHKQRNRTPKRCSGITAVPANLLGVSCRKSPKTQAWSMRNNSFPPWESA